LLGGLKERFNISDEDIKRFCGGGCTESMISGLSNVGSLDAGINLPLILERCIKNELKASNDFENFYARYISSVKDVVNTVTKEISNSQKQRALYNPVPMRTLLIDDCIDSGLDYNNGGARYKWSIINFAGMINVIDSMLVIRDLIFNEKVYTVEKFLERLAENDSEFLMQLRNHPVHFGDDNPDANAFSKKISGDILSMLDGLKPAIGDGFIPASIQFQSQVAAGKYIGAMPDGRGAGAPLCDSLAAIFGKDIKGPTALLNSVTSLALDRAIGVPVLNFNINPDFKNEILRSLILGYMKQCGIQIQITCISREMLEQAYENPDEHKNLVVRVGGYSEYFCRLNDELRRMVINRTIQNS
jgi:formate C-acetyltransferase